MSNNNDEKRRETRNNAVEEAVPTTTTRNEHPRGLLVVSDGNREKETRNDEPLLGKNGNPRIKYLMTGSSSSSSTNFRSSNDNHSTTTNTISIPTQRTAGGKERQQQPAAAAAEEEAVPPPPSLTLQRNHGVERGSRLVGGASLRPGAISVRGVRGSSLLFRSPANDIADDDTGDDDPAARPQSTSDSPDGRQQVGGAAATTAALAASDDDAFPLLLSATVVDQQRIEEDIERRLEVERENIRQRVLREVADGNEAVEVVVDGTNSNNNEEEERRRKKLLLTSSILGVCFLLLTVAVIAITVVSVSTRNKNNNNLDPTSNDLSPRPGPLSPSSTTSPNPTSSQCTFCYGSGEETKMVNNLGSTLVSQTPTRTCRDAYDESWTLQIDSHECQVIQAEAAWKCGCPNFPPPVALLNPNDEEGTTERTTLCKLCPEEGLEQPVPVSATDSVDVCSDADQWLQIVGYNTTDDDCDLLRRLVIPFDCKCVPRSSSDKDDGEDKPCIDVLDYIGVSEVQVQDYSIERTYILCPNTTFEVGIAPLGTFSTASGVAGGQLPITGGSNMRVLCGPDGSLRNNCTIRDGSFGMILANGHFIRNSIMQDNVHIQGITFINITNPINLYTISNVTIQDCLFEVRARRMDSILTLSFISSRNLTQTVTVVAPPPIMLKISMQQFDVHAIGSYPFVLGPAPSTARARDLSTAPIEKIRDVYESGLRRRSKQRALQTQGVQFSGTIEILNCIFRVRLFVLRRVRPSR